MKNLVWGETKGKVAWYPLFVLEQTIFENSMQTNLIMDKLHVVVMRRKNQTRYMACSLVAVFTQRRLPLSVALSY